jgi:hypothetical protein
MKLIPLNRGYEAMVDDEDYDNLMRYKWGAQVHNSNSIYATRSEPMQNFLMNPPKGFIIDHKDRNGLNNQKSNLRIATYSQNVIRPQYNSTGYRGVKKIHSQSKIDRGYQKWGAFLRINGVTLYCGRYDSPQEAALAYDKAAKQYHGEFAILNFPGE